MALRIWQCDDTGVRAIDRPLAEAAAHAGYLPAGACYWIEADEPDGELETHIEGLLGTGPAATEDVHAPDAGAEARAPRALVLKTLWYTDSISSVETGRLTLLAGKGVLATFRHGAYDPMGAVRERLERHSKLLTFGVWGIAFATVDETVKQHLAVAADLAEDVRQIESRVFSGERVDVVEQIYLLRREALESSDAVAALRLLTTEPVQKASWAHRLPASYLHGLDRRVAAAARAVGANETLLDSILSAHLGQIGTWQNEDMRKIAAWAAIIAVPTLVAGIYGMNFDHMPELRWLPGYPLSLLAMAILSGVLFRTFRSNGWL